jgi:hypothetical protein
MPVRRQVAVVVLVGVLCLAAGFALGRHTWGLSWVPSEYDFGVGGGTVHLAAVQCSRVEKLWADCMASVTSNVTEKVCGSPQGSRVPVVFLRGSWDDTTSALRFDPGSSLTAACKTQDNASGVYAKCIKWGFPPEPNRLPLFQACVRAARFDIAGDGTAHTKTGTAISIGAPGRVTPLPGYCLEAAWTETGATCANHARWVREGVLDAGVARPRCAGESISPARLLTYSPHRTELLDGGVSEVACTD